MTIYDNTSKELPKYAKVHLDQIVGQGIIPYRPEFGRSNQIKLQSFFKVQMQESWTVSSLTDELVEQDWHDVSRGRCKLAVLDVVPTVITEARARGLINSFEDYDVTWSGPSDANTTDVCQWLEAQTKGGVSVRRMKKLIEEGKNKFNVDGGSTWKPHYGCRHMLVLYQDHGPDVNTQVLGRFVNNDPTGNWGTL